MPTGSSRRYPVAHSVTDVAVSPDGRHVYASRTAANGADVAVLDTETGTDDAIGIAAERRNHRRMRAGQPGRPPAVCRGQRTR